MPAHYAIALRSSMLFVRGADWVQKRKSERRRVSLMAMILAEGDRTTICQCTMTDVSHGGTKLTVERPSMIPESFVLVLAGGARVAMNTIPFYRREESQPQPARGRC
jgi:hypothetical protein